MSNEKAKYIADYKKNNPIADCLGCGGGRWKWRRYLDGIDLRYGHNSKKAAEMSRAAMAEEVWSMYLYDNEPVVCHCGDQTTRGIINAVGECLDCADSRTTGFVIDRRD